MAIGLSGICLRAQAFGAVSVPASGKSVDPSVRAAEIAAETEKAIGRMVFAASALSAAIAAFSAAVGYFTWRTTKAFNERTAALSEGAEDRLKLETFISALPFITDSMKAGRGKDANSNGQGIGVLFVLVELGHLDFALTMLASMWPGQIASSEQATFLLDRIFRKGDEEIRNEAARVLFDKANHLVLTDDGEYAWPPYLDRNIWVGLIDADARELVILALMRIALCDGVSAWNPDSLISLLYAFEFAAKKDETKSVRGLAARAAITLCEVMQAEGDYEIDLHGGRRCSLSEIKSSMDAVAGSVGVNDLPAHGIGELEALKKWGKSVQIQGADQNTLGESNETHAGRTTENGCMPSLNYGPDENGKKEEGRQEEGSEESG